MRKMYAIKSNEGYYFGINQRTSEPFWTNDLAMAHFFFDINYAEGCRDYAYPDCEIVNIYICDGNPDDKATNILSSLNEGLIDIMVDVITPIKDEDLASNVRKYFEVVLERFNKLLNSKGNLEEK